MKKNWLFLMFCMIAIFNITTVGQAQTYTMDTPLYGLSSSGVVNSKNIISLSNGYVVVGSFTGNLNAFNQTMASFGSTDAFAAIYVTGNNNQYAPILSCVLQLGGSGDDEFLCGDVQNTSYLFLGGAHNSGTVSTRMLRANGVVNSSTLPNLNVSTPRRIGFVARWSLLSLSATSIVLNTTSAKCATIATNDVFGDAAPTSVNGLSYAFNATNSAARIFITGKGNAGLTIKDSSPNAATNYYDAFGPYVAQFTIDLASVSAMTGNDPTETLTGEGCFIKAAAFGTGFNVYSTGTFQGPLRPNFSSLFTWDNFYVARMLFPATGTPAWSWVQRWTINNNVGPVAQCRGLVVTPSAVLVLQYANPLPSNPGPGNTSYLVSYNSGNGSLNYERPLESNNNHSCMAYNESNNSLYLGGYFINHQTSFATSATTSIIKPANLSGIFYGTYNPANGYCMSLCTGTSAGPVNYPTATCKAIAVKGCKVYGTGNFQGTLMGVTAGNNSAFSAGAEGSSLTLSQTTPVSFCPGQPYSLSITAQPAPVNPAWTTSTSALSMSSNQNSATVIPASSAPTAFTVNVTATVGGCARTGTFNFTRFSGCAEGDIEDRYEGSEDLPSEVKVAPNPFTQQITLSGLNGAQRVEILNLEGKVVFTRTSPDSDVLEVHTQDWAAGMYLYRIIDSKNQITVGKVVKN